ncbi:autotransporter domain-containing protein [Bosea sp. LjRoot90]|uniref:autotransporter outer membrane beta-barrel domain-containing protein n=1 Tax=Bosea sp. LjRoot90 TaxID=3342342 RepID=UPI003ECFC655
MTAGRRCSAPIGTFFGTVSIAALVLGWGSSTTLAATYFVSTDGQLRAAMTAANGDGDPSSTIVLTASFASGVGNLPIATKPVTIDTQGFTVFGPPGNGTFISGAGAVRTLVGTFRGTDGGSSSSALAVRGGASVTNTGLAQGGTTGSGNGGAGVDFGGPGAAATLTNHGVIRGGAGATGGVGINARNGAGQIINTGTIEGGSGNLAIAATSATLALNIINSGTIRAGAGANAIGWLAGVTPTTGAIALELQAGSIITGNVVGNAAGSNDILRLGGADNWVLDGGIGSAGQYRNFDRLEKTGASTWTIAGSGNFAGPTNIAEGALIVNGSLAGSAVTVASGARLGGSGTVGTLTLASGSRITPGNSIGTLTVNGAYVQNAGAVYEVEVDPGTVTSDRIQVNGAATLASGAAITVVNSTGAGYVAGQRYTILTATGLTGSYGNTDLVLTPFLNLRNSTDATNAYLTVIRTNTAGGIGTTPNEVEVGKGVDSLPTGNAVQTDLYNQATLDAARRALGQLSGEIHASVRTALVDESWLLRAAVNDRLRSAFGAVGAAPMATLNYGFTADLAPAVKGPMPKLPSAERFAVWGQGYGSWGKIKSDGNAASLSHSTGGLLVGADVAAFDSLRFGVVAGYSRSEFDIDRRLSSASSDNYHLGLYGGGQWGALGLRTGLSYTWHDLETRRGIVAAGLGSSLRANYDAGTAQVFGELGYRIDLGPVAFEPFAGLAFVNLRSDRFNETGGAAALTSNSDDMNLGYSTLGLRASTTAHVQGMDLTLRGGLGWRHAFGDVDPKLTLAFAGSTPFSVAGLPIAKNAALVEAGLDIALGANAALGVSYAGQLAEDAQDHAFKANLSVRF